MTKFNWLLGVLCCLSFYSIAGDEYKDKIQYSAVPVWVEDTRYSADPTPDEFEGAVRYLLVDNQINFSDGQHSDYFRIAQQVVNRQGLSQVSELFFNFNPDYQQLDIHKIHVIRNGEIIDQTKVELNTMRQEQELNHRILNGRVTSLAILEDVQEGDIIDYAYSVHGSNPVFEGKKFLQVAVSWLVEVEKAKVIVRTDKNKPLNHKVTGTDKQLDTITTDQHLIYRWENNAVPAEANEQNYPHWYQHFDKLEFSEFDSWQEVANWATTLYDIEFTENNALLSLNQKWRQEAKNDLDYVKKVVSFVQNEIRYFGLELAENSHKPREPNLVFERRYGDCKDKALMISWLLEQHDIQSWSALVSAQNRQGINELLPSPGAFDHVINKIVVDDQVYWIDGTNMGQQGELADFSTNQFGRALVINKDSQVLDDMTKTEMVPWKNYLSETYTSKGYDQSVDLEFAIIMSGEEAQYSKMTLESEGTSYVADNILDYYKRQYPTSTWLSELEIEDNKELNQYQIRGAITIADYWDTKAEQLVVPLYGEHISSYLSLPDQVNRVTPLANYENVEVRHDITFNLHESINWNLDTEQKSFVSDGFNYDRKITTEPGTITVNHAYKPVSKFISTKLMPDHVEQIKSARDALYYSVVIDNKNSKKTKLRNRMRSLLNL